MSDFGHGQNPVWISCGDEYAVQGGPGGLYRLKDVWL